MIKIFGKSKLEALAYLGKICSTVELRRIIKQVKGGRIIKNAKTRNQTR